MKFIDSNNWQIALYQNELGLSEYGLCLIFFLTGVFVVLVFERLTLY